MLENSKWFSLKMCDICFTYLTILGVIERQYAKIASSLKWASLGWAAWLWWLLISVFRWTPDSSWVQDTIEISCLACLQVSLWFVVDICSSGNSATPLSQYQICPNLTEPSAVARCRAQNDPISVIRKPAEVLFVLPAHKYSESGAEWCYRCKLLSGQ